jgi:hypothetical protein
MVAAPNFCYWQLTAPILVCFALDMLREYFIEN